MCTVSMIMDHYGDKWGKPPYTYPPTTTQPIYTPPTFNPSIVLPSAAEIAEFRALLERAREYDKKNNEPDCELAEKKARLLDLAKELGVEIDFL